MPTVTMQAVLLSVRKLRRVDRHGDRSVMSTVFCPARARSFDLATCLTCPFLLRPGQDAIACSPPYADDMRVLPMSARLGSDACVGEAVGDAVLCVQGDVPAEVVASALREYGEWIAVVVDDEGRSVGIVYAAEVLRATRSACARRMAHAVAPVDEAAPLSHAVDRMVRERARALPVTGEDERVVALLTDLDALAWVVRHPRAMPAS